MFTGLITGTGLVRSITPSGAGGNVDLVIQTEMDLSALPLGASIACSGPCLTIVEKQDDWFRITASPETLAKTTVGFWSVGMVVNLEPALRLGDALGGHMVTGHIDGVVNVRSIIAQGGSHCVTLATPAALLPFLAPKGSVCLDGISLTVNDVGDDYFTVMIIPHTWQHTSIQARRVGDAMNIEIDLIARYIHNHLQRQAS